MGRTNAKARNMDDFFVLNAGGIARESAAIFLQHLPFFVSIAVLLVSPISAALILSRAFLPHSYIVTGFGLQIREFVNSAGFPNSRYTHLICSKLSQTIICFVLCFPIVVTSSLLARAAVAQTVAWIYAGDKPSWERLIEVLPRLWKRLVLTYIWAGVMVTGANAVILVLVLGVFKVVSVFGFHSRLEIGAALGGGIVYSIVFAHAMIVCNLATIVCVLEEYNYGIQAVWKALFLIRGRTRIALALAIIVNLSWAFVESLFLHRVMRGRSSVTNMALEGSLLVFMYSIVTVIYDAMSTVFYYTCKSAHLELVCLDTFLPCPANQWEDTHPEGNDSKV
ncbi:hypothetical protein SUGI_0325950 [Cryptomeria japonica]|uniref:uncharacterized protein LOC131072927 n=1 Tax=Cryptomeria japonica TaxID=3369 RepID=UPI002408F069|nr:uncharacterized protein LOC131072927 [Cryptomeria japonica]GLJ18398.1 hypothetical protein SUGI_0325950 [Cryptomeria japonica]